MPESIGPPGAPPTGTLFAPEPVKADAAGPSLQLRALLAVALTVSFYGMAVAVALGLIAGPFLVHQSTGRMPVWVALPAIAAGVAVLRAIVPARARWEPPGPELTRVAHPRLHALLDDVAQRTGEPPAATVLLDLDLNASVLEHQRKRILLLGLPLLAVLDKDELRAVVGHEYGHFAGGDTRFSAWIWRTRVAVLRTVSDLVHSDSWFRANVVRWPFEWYARLFLLVTNAVSRRAEFAADAVAARVASPDALGRALRRMEAVAGAWDAFWHEDVSPMLSASRRAPIANGFADMVARSDLSARLDDVVRADLETTEPDPYASHPTLRQRLEALGVEQEGRMPAPSIDRALDLLGDVGATERALLIHRFGAEVGDFPAAGWEEAGAVHLHRMRTQGEKAAEIFGEIAALQAGEVAANLPRYRDRVREQLGSDTVPLPDDAVDSIALSTLAASVVVAAAEAGCTVTAPPGEPVCVRTDEDVLSPFPFLARISAGQEAPAAWTEHPVVRAVVGTGP